MVKGNISFVPTVEAMFQLQICADIRDFVRSHKKRNRKKKKKNQVECPECGKVLGNNTKLRRHIRFIHKQEKLYRCNHCDHEDYRKDNMRVHVKNCHREADLDKSISNI